MPLDPACDLSHVVGQLAPQCRRIHCCELDHLGHRQADADGRAKASVGHPDAPDWLTQTQAEQILHVAVVAMGEGLVQGARKIEVKGRASHAGAAPEEGRNALIELSHQMLATQDIAKNIPGAQLNWTYAQSGSVRNQIPAQAIATADVRLLKSDAAEKLQAALVAKTQESHRVPDTHVHVSLDVGRPPYVAGERGMVLAQKARAIYAELDGRPLFFHPVTGGGTDAGFASGSGKAAVLESLGLAGWGFHAKDEYIEMDSIVPRLYLTSRLLQELGKAD